MLYEQHYSGFFLLLIFLLSYSILNFSTLLGFIHATRGSLDDFVF